MKIENVEDRYAIYALLFSLSNRIQTIGDKEFKEITIKQHFLMIALGLFENPPTLKEMGEMIGCSYQNVKRMANQLEKEKFLDIIQDKSDKRKLLLVSTGKFEQMAEEYRDVTSRFMNQLFDGIDKTDLEVTLQSLKKMDHNIGGVLE